VLALAVGIPAAALADRPEFSTIHPEDQYANSTAQAGADDPYADLVKQVQEKLQANGFDAGPVDGTFNPKTQAALAQYQRLSTLPVSGALDDETLLALGVDRAPTPPEGAPQDGSG
jgi:membrane-bound lytic murein transglycosylase B